MLVIIINKKGDHEYEKEQGWTEGKYESIIQFQNIKETIKKE